MEIPQVLALPLEEAARRLEPQAAPMSAASAAAACKRGRL